ncbi:MAG: hypothetical protein IJS54_07240 [Desulfovibrio sp.]|nr:hypothetical protein [Desulfovibrio sp.]
MSDSSRKMFPVATVMALVTGKEGFDIKEIAGYVAGRSICCDTQAKAVGVFAAAWLARWYPKFTGMIWNEGSQSWEAFVSQAKSQLGEYVSLSPMDERTKELANQALDFMVDAQKSVAAQTESAMKLEERVRELEPVAEQAKALQKKVDELEAKIKTMNTDMGGLRRKVAEYDGKVALEQDELMRTIKDAIKDGMKGMVVASGAAVAGAEGAASSAEPAAEENSVPDDFGFGTSGANADGFGF